MNKAAFRAIGKPVEQALFFLIADNLMKYFPLVSARILFFQILHVVFIRFYKQNIINGLLEKQIEPWPMAHTSTYNNCSFYRKYPAETVKVFQR